MGTLFATYLMKFSTDVLAIAPAAMGTIIFASRLWDAISDPMAGYLSDRTNSRFGRRRSWLFMAAIPMGLGLIMIWSPPTFIDGVTLIVWMAVALLRNHELRAGRYPEARALYEEIFPELLDEDDPKLGEEIYQIANLA